MPAEVDACTANPCQQSGAGGSATCVDTPYPAPDSATGRTCACTTATSTYQDDVAGCVDVDACVTWPCALGVSGTATCTDLTGGVNSTEGMRLAGALGEGAGTLAGRMHGSNRCVVTVFSGLCLFGTAKAMS